MVHKIFADLITSTTYSILRDHENLPEKVLLYPEEGWAKAASNSHWLLKTPWWSRKHVHVLEVQGTKRHKTVARILPSCSGELLIEGTFRGVADGDFRLLLTSKVSTDDQRRGYGMAGSLERGNRASRSWQTTHLAVTKRADYP